MENQKTKKSLSQRIEDLKLKKQKLAAEEARLLKQSKNDERKKRLHTFYEFGGLMFSDKWPELRKIIIDEKKYHSIHVYIDRKPFAELIKNDPENK